MIPQVGSFLKIIFCKANKEEKPRFIVYYNSDKCVLISLLCFFFKKEKKAENNRLKKPVGQNVEILFFFCFCLK